MTTNYPLAIRSLFISFILFTIYSTSNAQENPSIKCKNVTNERVRKNCIINTIQEFVDSNYDITAITPYAKPGNNKIYTRFKIDQTGKIISIKAKSSSTALELEAIKTLQSFPYLIPTSKTASTNKKEVFDNVFTLLITFDVKMTEINLSPQGKITDND
ncbi:hypothetical protein [Aquimarina sp. I32.4]|uniref:hypothetical protein n=1 Tax=Aquimarina sp. I32.4 TaxID=2053903 RepID=UPI000CDEEECC|nr:hypothetical protein [Aquimarina sp. I32.4]